MKTGQKGINLIKKYEGLQLKQYICPAGKVTIGYGHTGADVKKGMVITKEQAEALLVKDLVKFEGELNAAMTKHNVKLNQNQFDALISFLYNFGIGTLLSSTLWRFLKEGNYLQAAGQFERWVHVGHKKLQGLIARREDEEALFLSMEGL